MSSTQVDELTAQISQYSEELDKVARNIATVLVGEKHLVRRLFIGLLANGHVLLEGVPGLAKTLAVHCLANSIDTQFQRIQFTPDLLPSDLVGNLIYNPRSGEYTTRKGPIFANLILADEINRAPAKVQSALLEAMQERQVTIGEQTYKLPEPFLVLATQNPIEQEGTYVMPEAQVDRFMLKVLVSYPSQDEEKQILQRMASTKPKTDVEAVTEPTTILAMRRLVDQVYVDDRIVDYILQIVFATRNPTEHLEQMDQMVRFGASPRASIFLTLAAKAHAFLEGRGYVEPDDVKAIAPDVLRHRVLTTFEAEAEQITSDHIIRQLLANVPTP